MLKSVASKAMAPYLVVLNLKLPNKFLGSSVVILPDSIDGEEFRRLRVLLRWKWKATSGSILMGYAIVITYP